MCRFILVLLFVSFFSYGANENIKGHSNNTPTIMLSIDGFANFYLDKYKPKNLLKLANNGVRAKSLIPVFPTKTFPNHLSIVTGNYPQSHSIVHNKFYNRDLNKIYKLGLGKLNEKWLTSTTLWSVAEQNNIKTAIYFWPESEVNIPKHKPTYSYPYKHDTPNSERFNQLINWLKLPIDKRPELLLGYFSTIDSIGHDFGVNSQELADSIKQFDDLFGQFLLRLKTELNFDVNIILVSDHGMVDISKEQFSSLYLFDGIENLNVVNGQTQLYIYLDNDVNEESVYQRIAENVKASHKDLINVYKFDEFPKHWHLNQRTPVVPNLIIDISPPLTFESAFESGKATHGYDPSLSTDLHAIFIANGPSFKTNLIIEPFENIHVFPLIINLLGVDHREKIDGNKEVLNNIIQQ